MGNLKKVILIFAFLLLIVIAIFIVTRPAEEVTPFGTVFDFQDDSAQDASADDAAENPVESQAPAVEIEEYPGMGFGLHGIDEDDYSDEVYASCEEWETVGAEGFINEDEVSCEVDGVGVLTVGTPDGRVGGSQAGLILNVQCVPERETACYGVRMYPDFGNLGFSQDGILCYLEGSAPYTHLDSKEVILEGENCVLLGRTMDQQMSMEYVNPKDYGLCWFYDPTATELPETVIIKMQLFDLRENALQGIYQIAVVLEDGAYKLDSIQPVTNSGVDIEVRNKIKNEAVSILRNGDLCAVDTSFNADDVILDVVDVPYWSDAAAMDKSQMDISLVVHMGQLVAATVNTHSTIIGPATIYFIVSEMPSEELGVDNEIVANAVGYDWLAARQWDQFVNFNGLSSDSITVRNFAPIEE